MKKHYIFIMLSFILALSTYAQTPVITSVVDACGSDGKFVEIYVSGTLDFADYKLVRRSNANDWTAGVDLDISALGVRTDEFVYVGRDIPTMTDEFPLAGISASNAIENTDISHNGDDSYRLVEIAGDVVIDQFGGDTDGTGEPWEYVDTWVARNNGEGPNPTFTITEWTFGTIDDLDAVGLCNDATNPTLETVANSVGTYTPASSSSYCTPVAFPSNCTGGDQIDDFTIAGAGFSHIATGCSDGTYGDFSSDPTLQIDLALDIPYTFQITHNFANQWVKIWIDLNDDQVFDDSTELFFESTGGNNPTDGTLTIPSSAPLGMKRMRVITRWGSIPVDACNPSGTATSAWGETHDYTVNLTPPPSCPAPLNLSISNITASSADFSWDDVTSAATGYDYVLITDGSTPDDTTTPTGSVGSDMATVNLTGLSANTDYNAYVRSDCGSGDLSDWSVAESFTTPPTCVAPTNLVIDNLGNVTADLSWDATDSVETEGYDYVLITDGTTPDSSTTPSGSVSTGVTNVSLSSLTSSTSYDFYVRAVCSVGDESEWSEVLTFTTLCDTIAAPFSEDFNTDPSTIPDCWSQGVANAESWLFTDTPTGHIGNNGSFPNPSPSAGGFAWVDDSSPHSQDTRFESPLIDVSGLTIPALSFYFISDNEGDANGNVDFRVEVWDGAAWNQVFFSNQNSANEDWEEVVVDLSTLTITGDIQLAFIVDENNGTGFDDDLAIDDVSVDEAPSCIKPTNLVVNNVTSDSADLSWNGTSTDANGYDYVLITDGSIPDDTTSPSGTVASGMSMESLTGLTSNTTYDAYVRTKCTDGDSDWSTVVTFATQCLPFTAPYSENFDSASTPNIPNCWTTAGNSADEIETDDSHFGIDNPPSAPNFLKFGDVDLADGDEAILVSPQFSDLGSFDKRIRFKAAFEDGDVQNHKLYVGVMSDPTDASTFVEIAVVTSTLDETFSEFTVDLTDSALIGSSQYIAIAAGSAASFDELAIDDFIYEDIPSCVVPENLTVSNVTLDSADLSWDAEATAVGGYEYVLITDGSTPDDTTTPTGNVGSGVTNVNLTALTDGTSYDVYVRSVCADGVSVWSSVVSFSTDCTIFSTFPYTETFEDTSSTLNCWSTTSSIGIREWEFGTDTNAAGSINGNGMAFFDDDEAGSGVDNNATLLSPVFDLSAMTSPQMVFDYHLRTLANGESLTVDVWDGAAWQNVLTYTNNDGAWSGSGSQVANIDISTYTNTDFQVRFVYDDGPSDYWGWYAGIDNFTIQEPPTATVQVIHNSADPSAEFVDVYLDGALLLDDFEFRTATAFVDVPAETPIDIDIAPSTSADVSESIYNLSTTLTADETYIVVANGVIDPTQFDASVNTIDFGLDVFAGAQQSSTNAGETSVLVHHGSPDAPTVDVREISVPAGIIVDDISYSEFQGYLDLATQDYQLSVELADNSAVVASYEANLATLGTTDLAITVLASGFLDPSANQSGAAFGLWAALPTGGPLVELPEFTPPPANDDLCDAIPLTVGAQSTGDAYTNVEATAQANEPVASCFAGGVTQSVWFTFDAPASGEVTVTTDIAGGTFTDTEVAVYEAPTDCTDLTTLGAELGCDQDGGSIVNFNSIVDLTGLTPGVTYYIQVDRWNTATPGTFGIRVLDNNPPCPEPINLNVTGITATTADLNWDDVTEATLGFEWFVFESGANPSTATPIDTNFAGAGVTTVTASGLLPETDYDFYVSSDCDTDGESALAGPETFTTDCATFTPDYLEDFTNFVPDCWNEATDGDPSTGPTGFGSGDWVADGFLNNGFAGSARINLYDTGTSDWLLSPRFDLTAGGYEVLFKIGITAFSGTGNSPMGSDDEVQLLYSEDGGATWINLQTWAQGSEPSNAGETVIIDVSSITSSEVQFAFWGTEGSIDDPEDYNIYIDDFEVRTPPPCAEPLNLSTSNITDTSVDLSWVASADEVSGYEWVIMSSGDAPDPTTAVATNTVASGVLTDSVTGLTSETAYDAYVRTNCDADGFSDWSDVASFTTAIAPVIVSPGTVESETYCYDNSQFKEWLYQSSDGSPLVIEFLQGSVEVNTFANDTYDDLIIYDGQNDEGTELFNSDNDTTTAADLTGLTLTASSGFMYITLTTDGSVSCADGDETEIQFEVSIPEFLDYFNLQFPATGNITTGDSFSVFAQAYEAGLTDASDTPAAGIEAWIGYSTTDSNPNTTADWTWVPATANPGFDFTQNNDEYTLDLGAELSAAGTYYYASRWSLNGGPFTYGGILPDGSNGGEWGTGGFISGVLTVDPACSADAGTLIIDADPVSLIGGTATVSATENVAPTVPAGYQVLYVLTSGTGLVIEQTNATSTFDVSVAGDYTIHTLVYDPITLDLSIITPGVTTGFDVNALLIQGGGSICASLDVAGAPVTVLDECLADAGTLTIDLDPVALDSGGTATVSATEDIAPTVPAGYSVVYVLTSGTGLVIEQTNTAPTFDVTAFGDYTIHTLVYDPATLDLTTITPGVTTGFDVNALLIQGGGSICASLDVAGAPVTVEPFISTEDFDRSNFTFYPNPVRNELKFETTNQVESIKIFNILGQQVMSETPNMVSPKIDVEVLQSGTYLMNVTINGQTQNFRFIKE